MLITYKPSSLFVYEYRTKDVRKKLQHHDDVDDQTVTLMVDA